MKSLAMPGIAMPGPTVPGLAAARPRHVPW